ncbi:MAG: serine hydrolase [Cytophagaceae bacterium]|nr:MAG: serine hydrolase [Cytophagaceae bacterium]
MKSLRLYITLLFVAATTVTFAQTAETLKKIQLVELSLTGTTTIEGEQLKTIQEQMAKYKLPGVSIAVIENYQLAWAKGYGMADDSLKIPVTEKTLFQAASLSKSLNGVGVLKLVQDKKVDLYADINRYLKSWKFPYDTVSKNKKISLANLLSHTAGLTVHGFAGYSSDSIRPTLLQVLNGQKPANSAAIRSAFEPGLRSEYSGGGTTIAQQLVMDVTGKAYTDYMDKEILKPMGMTMSTYAQPPLQIKATLLASAYHADGKPVWGKYHVYPEQAAAGLWTNPTDLAAYIIETQLALEGKSAKVLNQATTRLRLTPYIDQSAAMGVFIVDMDGTKYFSHGGGNEGFRCQYFGSMEGGNGVVVMVNSDHGAIMSEIINAVAKVYGFKGLYQSRLVKQVTVDDATLQSYTGGYDLEKDVVLTVSKQGGQLLVQATGDGQAEIFPEAQNMFFLKSGNARLEFVKDDKGAITKVLIHRNGKVTEAKKVK